MATPKTTSDPAGVLALIESNSRTVNGHYIYNGPAKLQVGFTLVKPAKAYWLLTRGKLTGDKPFLVQTCSEPNCIEPEHYQPSRSPHGVMSGRTLADIGEQLDRIEAMLETILAHRSES